MAQSDTSNPTAATEYVEGEGSGYVIRVVEMLPVQSPALKEAGYTNPTALYVIFADGQVYADHDRHALVRELPGRNEWLHDHLKRLRSEVMA